MSKEENVTINTRGVPISLRNKFKVYCAMQQVSMQDAIIAIMDIAVEKNVKIKQRVLRRKKKK